MLIIILIDPVQPRVICAYINIVKHSIIKGPLDFDVFEFHSILDFNSKGSHQIASIFDI